MNLEQALARIRETLTDYREQQRVEAQLDESGRRIIGI